MSSDTDPYHDWLWTTHIHPDTPLSPVSLGYLVRLNGHMAADWRQLGLRLGVPNDKLKEIQANHAGHPNQCQLCLTDIFDWWLRNAPNPTCRQIIRAIIFCGLGEIFIRQLTITCKLETETESDGPSQPQVEKKSGLRKIWSTFQRCTADFVKSALGKLSGLFASLDVRHKYKKSKDVVRWWFEVEGALGSGGGVGAVMASTQWKLE